MLDLRPYQREATAAVLEAEQCGIQRPLITLPMGTGKTVIFAHLIRQAYAKLKEINPSLSLGVVKAEEDEHGAPCVIASVQTLARESRLQRLPPDSTPLW